MNHYHHLTLLEREKILFFFSERVFTFKDSGRTGKKQGNNQPGAEAEQSETGIYACDRRAAILQATKAVSKEEAAVGPGSVRASTRKVSGPAMVPGADRRTTAIGELS